MDDFEKYIKENRYLFDEQRADKSKIWDNIESRLNTPKSIVVWRFPILKFAASILILVGAFSIINMYLNSGLNYNNQNNIVNQELRDIDTYYKDLVSFQVQLVKNSSKLQDKEKEEFLSFMDELDEEYNTLKLEMKKNLNNEYILEAIVNNYKKRIELIENLLEQINNSKKSNENEGYIL
ncbi:hypothetical protein [Aquimarina muelleri]|uniref:Anti-sigma factor n=1 Tax=Aquimarina muelleri TaxID=279356 RepID=A0A918JXL1_9FLAO|nr:hypothetical protein [Aquimarina muelleri]MCX2763362.1 hypothetical protein [Aquimarina muelleri]GGX28518.1 hypothetical protein GCM10007384_32150 [Aquimarina muelleri]